MSKKVQHIDIEIDKLTNSIENAFSGDSFIREPEGVDFVVDPRPLKDWEKKQISDIIAHYKKTGEIKKISTQQKTKKGQSV